MSVNLFFTLPTVIPGAQNAVAGQGTLSPQVGAGFFDMILQRLAETGKETKAIETPLQSDNPLLDKTPKLDVAALLAETPEIADQVAHDAKTFDLDTLAAIADALALNQQIFDEKLHPELANGLLALKVTPENLPKVKDILASLLIGNTPTAADESALNDFMTKIEEMVNADGPSSIVINLTPAQMNQIAAQIKSLRAEAGQVDALTAEQMMALNAAKNTDDNEETDPAKIFAAFFAGTVNILPPKEIAPVGTTPFSAANTAKTAPDAPVKTSDDLAAKLNALVTGGTEDSIDGEFKELLKQYEGNKPKIETGMGTEIGAKVKPPAVTPDLNVLQNWPFAPGAVTLPWSDGLPQDQTLGTSAMQITGPASLTNIVTGAQHAGAAHPAVQVVASALQKNGAAGESKNFTLQLDPPELGRIEVRMEFSKDKVLKTHMVIEKPETFVMLQRDGHALERSLQAIGIDGSGDNSLSFELASQDHEFGQNGRHDGGGSYGNGGEAGDIEIIESTMTWYVDPDSGHMRYDFVV